MASIATTIHWLPKHFADFWTTPHNLDLQKVADLFDIKYYKAQSSNELKLSINSANDDNGIALIDAIIDIDDNIKENKEFLLKIDKGLD